MKLFQQFFSVKSAGRELREITREVSEIVQQSGIQSGTCQVFIRHTSASLLINENADPDVLIDLETFFSALAQDGDPRFVHRAEGPDDMSAHVRSALTQTDLMIPIVDGRMALGTWQGIYLWEHRRNPHHRHFVVTVLGR